MQALKKLLAKLLRETADKIDSGNCELSDNYLKLKKWFPDATKEEMLEKLVEEAVNYLDDEDNPYGSEKIWRYLN